MPPKPMALTPARNGRSAGQAWPFFNALKTGRSPVNSGCGWSQPVVGGRIWASRARAALISPATPAAALVWPIFALIEPMVACAVSAPASRSARPRARSSVASPTVVPVPCPSKYATVLIPRRARR